METPILDIWSPDPGDDYALTQDLAAMADDIEDALLGNPQIVYVANTTARTALVNARTLEGRPPSTTEPLFVFRADAQDRNRLEYTRDGVSWTPFFGAPTRVSGNVYVGNTSGTTITLPAGMFSSLPTVVVTPYDADLVIVPHVTNRTNSSFYLRLYTLGGTAVTGNATWVATATGSV